MSFIATAAFVLMTSLFVGLFAGLLVVLFVVLFWVGRALRRH